MARALSWRSAAALLVVGASGFVVGAASQAGATPGGGAYVGLDVYARVLARIEESHVTPVDQQALVYASLHGMTTPLDPHSQFFDPTEWARLEAEAGGTYVGAGIDTAADTCGRRVTTLVADGPAAAAGVAVGECVIAVDGLPLAGRADAEALLRGTDGQAVRWWIEPGPGAIASARREVALLYRPVTVPSVTVSTPAPGVLSIRLRQFRVGTASEVQTALTRAAVGTGTGRGVLLDLRGNPGGRLDEAVATVDLFLTDGAIVTTEGRAVGASHTWSASASPGDYAGPLRVLVDHESASAAEVVAGALQDRGRARLVGATTYGKGTVQSLFHFEDGSALKLTDARYTLPSRRGVADHAGLAPDVSATAVDTIAAAVRDLDR